MQAAGPVLNTMKVVLLGDNGVGKKTYVHKLAKKQHQNIIQPGGQQSESLQLFSQGINFHLESTHGPCQVTLIPLHIDFTEYNKQQDYYHQVSQILLNSDASLLMFSLLERQSYKSIPSYFSQWVNLNEYNKPTLLVSTNVDDWKNIKIKQRMINYHRKKNLQFYNVSSKAAYNLLKPLEFLFKKKFCSIQFAFTNPEKYVDFTEQVEFKQKQELEKQIYENQTYMIPDDNDQ